MENNPDDRYKPKNYVELTTPEWVKNATLYELNIRQFSQEGTLLAIIPELPRLKSLGIDIIWLMPIHPIGEVHRKGSLGSYYAVKDYWAVNPEFGTKEDLKRLIDAIHQQGMYVILDWVANHTSWDNTMVTDHPEWYMRSRKNTFQSTRWRDYDDIIELDYGNPELRRYMTVVMKYWLMEFDIDGYRCDIASFVPLDFWENLREELEEIKPVFMLAEAEDRELHRKAFDATYNWTLWNILHQIAVNHNSVKTLTEAYLAEHVSIFPKAGLRMNFTDNHDKNSWEGTPQENFGDALKAAIVLSATFDGIPLVYSGQEAGLDRSLAFFEKDPIEWKNHDNASLYASIFALKHRNQALWNGIHGGEMIRIMNDHTDQILSFVREKNGQKVIVFINLSKDTVLVQLDTSYDSGTYTNLFTGQSVDVQNTMIVDMAPWDYLILYKD